MGERLTTDSRLWRLILASALAMFLVNLDFFAVQVALPDMAKDLNTDINSLQWVISGYMLSLAAFLIVGGRLADILGRKTWLILGTTIFGLSSLIGGFAASAEVLIGMRILQGVGAAILMPVCLAVVTNAFPAAKVQRAIGLVFGIAAIGQALGPLIGGVLTELTSWRWVLWLNVPVALLVIFLTVTAVQQSFDDSEGRKIDWGGLVLIVLSISLFTLGIDMAAQWGWIAVGTLGLIAVGLFGFAFFIFWEKRARPPLLDLSLFKIREFSVMTAAGAVGNSAGPAAIFLSTVYLQTGRGFSPIEAGVAFLLFSGGVALTSQIAGRLEAYASWKVMVSALVIGGLGLVAMGVLIETLPLYLIASFFGGAGAGLAWTFASVVTQSVSPANKAGAASGVVLTILIGLGGVATAVAATLIAGGSGDGATIAPILIGFGILELLTVPFVVIFGRETQQVPRGAAA